MVDSASSATPRQPVRILVSPATDGVHLDWIREHLHWREPSACALLGSHGCPVREQMYQKLRVL